MNIQQIINASLEEGTKWKLLNIRGPSHTDYVPHDGTELNRLLYDIVIPATPWIPNPEIPIKMHVNLQQCKDGTVQISYPETQEQNIEMYGRIFEGYTPEETSRYKSLQRQTILDIQERFQKQPLVVSITKRLHFRVLDTIRKERYFNRMISFAQITRPTNPTQPTTIRNLQSCDIFKSDFNSVPSLYHSVIRYLHVNLKRSSMFSMTTAKSCSCDQAEILHALHLPPTIYMELWSLHLSCSAHYEQTTYSCNRLQPKRFFVRKTSKLEELLNNSENHIGQFLFNRWEIRSIRMHAFQNYSDNGYTEEQKKILQDGISEIEKYE